MRKEYWIGLGVAAAILVVSSLISPWSAILAGLVLAAALATAVCASNMVHVEERTDLVVCSQPHNAVLRVVRGPATTVLLPLWEKAGMVIDTTCRKLEVRVENVTQHDGQPAMYLFSVWVWFHLAPRDLTMTALARFLRDLERPEGMIRERTNYLMHCLIGDGAGNSAHNNGRCPAERRLKAMLAAEFNPMGIVIERVRLIVYAPDSLRRSVTEAEQYRVTTEPQLEAFDKVLKVAGSQPQGAHNLTVMQLAGAVMGSRRALPMVDVGPLWHLVSGSGSSADGWPGPDQEEH